jgi:hypothetical protein
MRATIQKINVALPHCDARSDSDILFVFQERNYRATPFASSSQNSM